MPSKYKKIAALAAVLLIIIIMGVYFFIAHKKNKIPVNPEDKVTDEKVTLADGQNIHVLYKHEPEKGLLILVSDSHDKKAANEYAHKFVELSYYVVNIDSQSLLKLASADECANFSEKLLNIAEKVQDKYGIDDDYLPILVGNKEGASLVYTALAQSDRNSFHAAVSINFSQQVSTNVFFCAEHDFTANKIGDITEIQPIKYLPASWYIFEETSAAQNAKTKAFESKVRNAKLTIAEQPKETPLEEAIQILQWLDPRLKDQISSDNSGGELPLIEVPVSEESAAMTSPSMAIILTGDGGWAEIDKSIAKILSEKGIPTVAFDSLSYFWRTRTPEETAKDIEDTITQYREKWQKTDVIVIGYSFGADVLPFTVNRLSPETQQRISVVALLGMGKTAAFKFRLSSWLNADKDPNRLPLLPEVENMKWANSVCIYGIDDEESACKETKTLGVKVISMSGDHHFDEKYDELVQHILDNTKALPQPSN